MLFERFYRPDVSRSNQTGGYGIGLSIAQAIVSKHKGKISAQSSDGSSIIIKVILKKILNAFSIKDLFCVFKTKF
ncbi:MAG TPA: hypothetical protein GX707_19580 [Epulopiscium sp.]|nr:hypothetical protein [Candidatus Epulonipiscium sp.]